MDTIESEKLGADNNKKIQHTLLVIFLFVTAAIVISSLATATTYTFDNGGGDGDWANTANWTTDVVPGVGDDAIITATVDSNSGAPASVNTLTVNNASISEVNITVANGATFDNSVLYQATITGDVTFADGSEGNSYNNGIVDGDAFFNDESLNYATVTGNATFNTTAYHTSAPTGGVFTFSVRGWSGRVEGVVYGADNSPITTYSFSGSGITNTGYLEGAATFSGSGCSNDTTGVIVGDVVFNNSSYNNATVQGNATFNTGTYNHAIVTGNATFNNNSYNDNLGTINGDAVFSGSSYNNNIVTGDATFDGDGDCNNYGTVEGNATFSSESRNQGGTVEGDAVFNDNSLNVGGTVLGTATFNDTSSNSGGTVSGNACFSSTATNDGTVSGNVLTCSTGGSQQPSVVVFSTHSGGGLSDGVGGAPAYEPDSLSHELRSDDALNNNESGSNSTNTEIFHTETIAPGLVYTPRDLELNSVGEDVRALQVFLNTHGYSLASDGPGSLGFETDFFGPLTQAALAGWQAAHGVSPAIGYYGPITRAAMMAE